MLDFIYLFSIFLPFLFLFLSAPRGDKLSGCALYSPTPNSVQKAFFWVLNSIKRGKSSRSSAFIFYFLFISWTKARCANRRETPRDSVCLLIQMCFGMQPSVGSRP